MMPMTNVPLAADNMSRFFEWHLPNQDAHFGPHTATDQWPLPPEQKGTEAEEKEREEPQPDDNEVNSEAEDDVPLGHKKVSGASKPRSK